MHSDYVAMETKEELILAIISNARVGSDVAQAFESDVRDCVERILQIERFETSHD